MFIYIHIYTPHSITIKFTTKYFSNTFEQYIIYDYMEYVWSSLQLYSDMD